jgi:uncharacterized cupredoxin-like copper-binding protein
VTSRASLGALSVTVAALMLASGCGGDDDETASAGSAASAGGQTVSISETDYELDPSDPTVQPGTVSFRVTNDGGVAHNLEVEGPKGEVELEQDIDPGESGTLTVDLSQPGSYEMYCPVGNHRDLGMEGEITVGSGGSGGSSGSDDAGGTTTTTTTGGGGYGY